jgi:putative phosphoribosyl transferase
MVALHSVVPPRGSVVGTLVEATESVHTGAMGVRYHDRVDAGVQLAASIDRRTLGDAVVVGLARGGLPVAAEVARRFSLPLDALAVGKVGHPLQPEYALGAVAHGSDDVYLRSRDGLTDRELRGAVDQASRRCAELDRVLHGDTPAVDVHGKSAVLVDDGLATGATMVAAVRWARAHGAVRVVVAVPVGAAQSLGLLRREADEVICPCSHHDLGAVGLWYDDFSPVETDEVLRLLEGFHAAAVPC